ncbi:HsdM family class I SAM-dependent methyltransferase [Virgibacillus dakarensis]|uniref:HsdM family class I SAM-dependent methyltransferase n=1 Tax=Virgibacillus dakarensis TaxID=1917889 RepID=UPI000B4343BF|nr:N-6 DNA methylase [Virgibacillus dakarensis]
MLNKENLINDLKELHIEIVQVYKSIFEYKFENDTIFHRFVEEEYERDNIVKDDEKSSWNVQYFHRSAYTLLNKILFIRICEDKGFMLNDDDKIMGQELNSKVGQKLSMIGLQKWSNLISNYSLTELIKFAFKDMNRSYRNINLYKDDVYDWLIPNNTDIENGINDKSSVKFYNAFEALLKKIIETLDTSRYNFGTSSDNVLGDVYEKFMDRETRKKLGQFYTPDYIIEYILKNTVENTNVLEDPFVKVLDPACGSGHFLIKAYDILRGKFEGNISRLNTKFASETYIIYEGDEKREIKGYDYWKKENIHYHILNHCIYGADIDSFAIQLTTINLLLKDLDNFTDRINVIESDSLVKWEQDYDWKELENQLYNGDLFLTLDSKDSENNIITLQPSWDEAIAFIDKGKFWSQKFDYIVGNPPYISFGLRGVNKINNEYYNYILNKYSNSAEYKISIYALFIERGIELLKEDGKLSYITPDSYLLGMYFQKIRQHILNSTDIEELLILNYEAFQDASIGKGIVSLFINQKADNWNVRVLGAFNENEVEENKFPLRFQLPQDYFDITPKNRFYIVYSEEEF